MVVRHSEAPKSHATGRIFFSDFGECHGGLFVSERMEDGHGAIEPRLHRGVTGYGKVHFAKLSELSSGVLVLGKCIRHECQARAREHEVQNACQSHFTSRREFPILSPFLRKTICSPSFRVNSQSPLPRLRVKRGSVGGSVDRPGWSVEARTAQAHTK